MAGLPWKWLGNDYSLFCYFSIPLLIFILPDQFFSRHLNHNYITPVFISIESLSKVFGVSSAVKIADTFGLNGSLFGSVIFSMAQIYTGSLCCSMFGWGDRQWTFSPPHAIRDLSPPFTHCLMIAVYFSMASKQKLLLLNELQMLLTTFMLALSLGLFRHIYRIRPSEHPEERPIKKLKEKFIKKD